MKQIYTVEKYSLYELIKNELEEKAKNWNTKEKIDYIYIRMCQIFNYDERWNYTTDINLKNEIYDYNINIFNIDIRKLVCSTFNRALCDLVNIFLIDDNNFDIALTEGDIEDGHMYSLILLRNGTSYIYDPIKKHNDFLNSKIGAKLQGIKIYNNQDDWDNDILQEKTYQKIGYRIIYPKRIETLRNNIKLLNLNNEKLLDRLISEVKIKTLGIHEVNNLLNLYSKDIFNKNLKQMGINLEYDNSSDSSRFYYLIDYEIIYVEEENKEQVVFKKIKNN